MSDKARLWRALTQPRGVALMGASNDPSKTTARPLKFLRQHGFKGNVYPLNRRRETVLGERAYRDLNDIQDPIDHAYILLNADNAVTAFEQCADRGIPLLSVLADGFAEAGAEGKARQRRLLEIGGKTGCRILGPNSMGVIDTRSGFACTSNAAFAAERLAQGRWAVLSQSGSLIGTILSRGQARGIGFANFVSLGNEADLGVGEVGQILFDDPGIDGFLLFLETLRRSEQIARFAAGARALGKPIVAYKLGRSDAGQELAVSHTGAMLSSDAAVDCFLRSQGIVRVDLFESLLELPLLLAGKPDPARPKTVTVVTTTGGGGAMVVDRLAVLGLDVQGAPRSVDEHLKHQGIDLKPGRLVDVTLAGANYRTMKLVLSALMQSQAIGVLVVTIGSSAQFHPELAVRPLLDAVTELGPNAVPVVAFPLPQADRSLAMLAEHGISSCRTPETCAEVVQRYLTEWKPKARIELTTDIAVAAALIDNDQGVLHEVAAMEVLHRLGIATPPSLVLRLDQIVPDSLPFAYPVVAKLISIDLPHKTDAGAIRLGIANRDQLIQAISEMSEAALSYQLEARIKGVLIQVQQTGLAEVLLGLRRDPTVGSVVTLGMGGVLAEIYRDFALRLAPVDHSQALAMIEEVKGLAVVRGYRGLPLGDIDALAKAVVKFSRLAAYEVVTEAEINPLIIRPSGAGVVAVDGLIRMSTGA